MDNELKITLRLKDQATRNLKRFGRAIATFARSSVGLLKKVFRGFFSLKGLIAGAAIGGAIKVFADFEFQLQQVATLLPGVTDGVAKFGDAVLRIAKDTGQDLGKLNKALFDTISGGTDAAQATEVLATAARLATGGATDVASAMEGLVRLLVGYNLDASKAGQISDLLFAAMKKGITTIGELAPAIGKVANTAADAGLSMTELLAAVAQLTKAFSTDEAVINLQALLLFRLQRPTDEAAKLMDKLGISIESFRNDAGLPFLEWLKMISAKLRGNQKDIKTIFSMRAAFKAFTVLSSAGAAGFAENLEEMGNAAGSTEDAFQKMVKTITIKIQKLKNSAFALLIVAVGELSDELGFGIDKVREFFDELSGTRAGQVTAVVRFLAEAFKILFSFITDKLQKWRDDWGTLFEDLASFITLFADSFVDQITASIKLIAAVFRVMANQLPNVLQSAFAGFDLGDLILKGDPFSSAVKRVKGAIGDMRRQLFQLQEDLKNLQKLTDPKEIQRIGRQRAKDGASDARFDPFIAMLGGTGRLDAIRNALVGLRVIEGEIESKLGEIGQIGGAAFARELQKVIDGAKPEVLAVAEELIAGLRANFTKFASDVGLPTEALEVAFQEMLAQIRAVEAEIEKNKTATQGAADTADTAAKGPLRKLQDVFEEIGDGAGDGAVEIDKLSDSVNAFNLRVAILQGGGEDSVTGRILRIRAEGAAEIEEFRKLAEGRKDLAVEVAEFERLINRETSELIIALKKEEKDRLSEIASELTGIFANSFTDAFSSIIEQTKTVAQAFKDLVRQILAELARLALSKLFTRIFASAFGSLLPSTPAAGGGGVGGADGGLPALEAAGGAVFPGGFQAFRAGGIVSQPTLGLVGEGRFDEAVIPMPNGKVPVDLQNAGRRGDINITFEIKAFDTSDGTRVILQEATLIKAIIAQAMRSDTSFRERIRVGVTRRV